MTNWIIEKFPDNDQLNYWKIPEDGSDIESKHRFHPGEIVS